METTPDPTQSETGPEAWVREAIAEQEEYIKRWRGCQGRPVPHKWGPFRPSSQEGTVPSSAMWSACIHCGVTETKEDYHRKMAAQPPRTAP